MKNLKNENITSLAAEALLLLETGRKIVCTFAKNHRESSFFARLSHSRKPLVIVNCGLKTENSRQLSAEDVRAKYSHLCRKKAGFPVIQIVFSLQNECIVNWYQRSCSSMINLPEKKAKGRKFTLQSHRRQCRNRTSFCVISK